MFTVTATVGSLDIDVANAQAGFFDANEIGMVTSNFVIGVPEPTTLALLGSGLHIAAGYSTSPRMVSSETNRRGRAEEQRVSERRSLPRPAQFGISIPANASASMPSRTPTDLALGGSGHADTVNSCPARPASVGDLREYAVRLMKRRDGHGLRRRAEG